MPYVMAALTVVCVVVMSRWLLSGHREDEHVQLLPDGSTPDLEAGTRPPADGDDGDGDDDTAEAAGPATGDPSSTNAADLVKQGRTVRVEDEAPADDDAADDEPAAAAPRSAADIHVEGAGKELDQEVYDAEIAAGKSERTARAKAKAAWVRAQKKAKMAEQEAAQAAADEDEGSGDEDGAAASDATDADDAAASDDPSTGDEDE